MLVGEWTGPWGDDSEEFRTNEVAIAAAFKNDNEEEKIKADHNDGTFLMEFEVSYNVIEYY